MGGRTATRLRELYATEHGLAVFRSGLSKFGDSGVDKHIQVAATQHGLKVRHRRAHTRPAPERALHPA